MHRQIPPLLQDAHVVAGELLARKGIERAILRSLGFFGRGRMALELVQEVGRVGGVLYCTH